MKSKTTSRSHQIQSPSRTSGTEDNSQESNATSGGNFTDWKDANDAFKSAFDISISSYKNNLKYLFMGFLFLLYFCIGLLVFLAHKFPNDSVAITDIIVWPLTFFK